MEIIRVRVLNFLFEILYLYKSLMLSFNKIVLFVKLSYRFDVIFGKMILNINIEIEVMVIEVRVLVNVFIFSYFKVVKSIEIFIVYIEKLCGI